MFLACAFLLMPQAVLGQRTYAGVDLMEAKSPYREALARPPHVESLVQTDQAESLAGRVSFFRALRNGTYQRWDPNLAGGHPSGTLPLNALLSPFSVGFLFLPAWYAIGLKVFLALIFCQSFMYLLVRRLGVAVGPAVLAGVAYTFSGVNLVFIHRVDAVFLVPALFWAVHRLITGKSDLRGAAVLGGFVAWAWAEGFPSGWVFCVYATAAWAAWLAVRAGGRVRDVVRRAVLPAAGLVWGVALCAITLVPFVSEVLDRGTLDVRVGPGGGHIPSIQIFGLLDLSATGPPLSGPWWSGLNPVESVSHVGMIAAVAVAAVAVAAVGQTANSHHAEPNRTGRERDEIEVHPQEIQHGRAAGQLPEGRPARWRARLGRQALRAPSPTFRSSSSRHRPPIVNAFSSAAATARLGH